jgi:hypothetical protein
MPPETPYAADELREIQSAMDDATKTATAAAVYRYLCAREWFRESTPTKATPRLRVTPESLAQDLAQGRRLLADGVLVYPGASPPVVGDDLDPQFLAAITGRDDAVDIEADQREMLRGYILRGGNLPRRRHEREK